MTCRRFLIGLVCTGHLSYWLRVVRSLGLATIFCSTVTFAAVTPKTVTISGSRTLEPVFVTLVNAFEKNHPGVSFKNIDTGSFLGYTQLVGGAYDMARLSLLPNKKQLAADSHRITVWKIASGALCVIVNKKAPAAITRVTKAQLAAIYFNKKPVGWEVFGTKAKGDIGAYGRSLLSSGMAKDFRWYVTGSHSEAYANQVITLRSSKDLVKQVGRDPEGVGYVYHKLLTNKVRPLLYAENGHSTYVACNEKNAKAHRYPLRLPFYIAAHLPMSADVNAFVQFVLSPAGQKIIADSGLIPLKPA